MLWLKKVNLKCIDGVIILISIRLKKYINQTYINKVSHNWLKIGFF